MKEFNSWHDIQDWCKENGFEKIAKRMQINNDCWNSCGEFGRSQVYICDNLRFAESEEDAMRKEARRKIIEKEERAAIRARIEAEERAKADADKH